MIRENPKHKKILDTAHELFWKHGLKRVSIEEICAVAGVSKMTFYKHFANKTALAKYILDGFFGEAMAEYRSIMDSDMEHAEKVKRVVAFKLKNSGGISQELVNEMYKSGEPEILEFIRQWSEKSLSMILNDFLTWQKNGDIRSGIKPEFMMYLLNKLADLTTDDSFTRLYASPAEMVNELTNFFFYGLMPVNKVRSL